MSVLIYISSTNSHVTRVERETIAMGQSLAKEQGSTCHLVHIGSEFPSDVLDAAVAEAILVKTSNTSFDSKTTSHLLSTLGKELDCSHVLVPHNSRGKAVLGRLAIKLDADAASDVISFSNESEGILFRRNSYSGKANTVLHFKKSKVVLSVSGDGLEYQRGGENLAVNSREIEVSEPTSKVIESVMQDSEVSLADANLVVSAGRGMKSADNWGIVEDLAKTIGAATACSRPVADSDWRPHHEHVGQTGLSIRPNLYIAIGISGAIQHLAGVNNSKTIVVINNDPEAPFFKAADYGICGDLFEVVPKLTKAIQESS